MKNDISPIGGNVFFVHGDGYRFFVILREILSFSGAQVAGSVIISSFRFRVVFPVRFMKQDVSAVLCIDIL